MIALSSVKCRGKGGIVSGEQHHNQIFSSSFSTSPLAAVARDKNLKFGLEFESSLGGFRFDLSH
jgi:hypothetical protein